MDSEQLVTIIGSGGGGVVLLALVNGFIKWVSGSSARERVRNTDLVTQRRKAIEEREAADADRDAADDLRRRADSLRWEAEEHVAILQRQLWLNGIKPYDRTNHPF